MATSPKSKDSVAWLGVADDYAAVTKSDSTAVQARALYVGGTGDVVIRSTAAGTAVTFKSVAAGSILPVYAYHVMAATTATDIVALF